MKITLDSNANWDSSVLGTFDESSSLAEAVDADANGIITEDEIEHYKEANPELTAPKKDYTVIKGEQTPQNCYELMDLIQKASETYDGMEKDARQISEDSNSFLAQCNSLCESSNPEEILKQAKSGSSGIEQLSEDFNITSSSVDNAIENAEKNGVMKTWMFGFIAKNLCNQLAQKEDTVKQLIEKIKIEVEDTQKTVESKDNPKDKTDKNDKTKTV